MDYEKKYNEILAWAKKYKARLNGVPIEDIFPELRESEDERIRKELINFLRSPFIKENLTDEKVAPWLDWLEKQKEQKPTDKIDLKFNIGDTIVNKKNGEKCTISNRCLLHQYYSDTNHCHEIKFDEQDDWELVKEQKPNFSEEDSTDFEIEVHEIIAQARNDSRLNDADVLKQFEEEAAFALMLKANKLIEQQKPAKWSEEDKKMLDAMIDIVSGSFYEPLCPRKEMLAWLKSLRPSWKPSDQDELMKLSDQDELMKLKYAGTSTKLD